MMHFSSTPVQLCFRHLFRDRYLGIVQAVSVWYISWVITGRSKRVISAMQWTSVETPLCMSRLAGGMSPRQGRCWRGAPIQMCLARRMRHPSFELLAGGMRVLWRWALSCICACMLIVHGAVLFGQAVLDCHKGGR